MSETLSTVRARIRQKLQDPNSRIWPSGDIDAALNEACVDLQQRTLWLEDYEITHVVSGTASYARSTDKVQNMTVQCFDKTRIDAISIYELDRAQPDWRTDTAQETPSRVYQDDWDSDALWPTPNTTGDTVTFSSEYGVIVAMTDGTSTMSASSEFGIITSAYRTDPAEDWRTKPTTFTDPGASEYGIVTSISTPAGNLESYYRRWPDSLVNDSDYLPFPDWTHWALEDKAMSLLLSQEGDGYSPQQAEGFRQSYEAIWIPFIRRILDRRTPDMGMVWKPEGPRSFFASRLSRYSPVRFGPEI